MGLGGGDWVAAMALCVRSLLMDQQGPGTLNVVPANCPSSSMWSTSMWSTVPANCPRKISENVYMQPVRQIAANVHLDPGGL